MEIFDREAVKKLNTLCDKARNLITEAIKIADIPACVSGCGSMFRVHMKQQVPSNYRETYVSPEEKKLTSMLLDYLFDNGIMSINTCSFTLSTVMSNKEIEILADVLLGGFRKIKDQL